MINDSLTLLHSLIEIVKLLFSIQNFHIGQNNKKTFAGKQTP